MLIRGATKAIGAAADKAVRPGKFKIFRLDSMPKIQNVERKYES